MSQLVGSILGPRLYRIYTLVQSGQAESGIYSPNLLESTGNNILKGIHLMWNIGIYTSPFIIPHMYRKDYFCLTGCISLGKFATGIGLLMIVSLLIRGLGRFINPQYQNFLTSLQIIQRNPTNLNKQILQTYDFDFWAWPVDFAWNDVEGDESKATIQVDSSVNKGKVGPLSWAIGIPCNFAAWATIHLFGRHLIYPGSTDLLHVFIAPMLETGRQKLVVENGGVRNKLLTRDGNDIETMFVDRRRSKYTSGSTLVVCCEGNAGFYEVGIMSTALAAGYSVLGWNHPGFGGSTGTPFPSQEQNAVDGVMQFAIHKLGFKVDDIIVYAWSIGGYTGAWAAMNYPEIKGLVLDASFDDLLPLALPRMPVWMGGLVKRTIRQNMNLNIADLLCKFPGPVTLIRRTLDEIITTVEGDISTNRGNDLLIRLLKTRYPNLFQSAMANDALKKWISQEPLLQGSVYRSFDIEDELCLAQLVSYVGQHGLTVPLSIGDDWSDEEQTKMLLFLASKYLVDVPIGHNNPLDSRFLRVPWAPIDDPSYVQLE